MPFFEIAAGVTGDLESLGFFLAGIIPGAGVSEDRLVLQYLNNVPIDYDAIQVQPGMAQTLLDYVRNRDPNRLQMA